MKSDRYLIDQINPQESWRIFRIMAEFVDGIETLSSLGLQSPSSAPPGAGRTTNTTAWQRILPACSPGRATE